MSRLFERAAIGANDKSGEVQLMDSAQIPAVQTNTVRVSQRVHVEPVDVLFREQVRPRSLRYMVKRQGGHGCSLIMS